MASAAEPVFVVWADGTVLHATIDAEVDVDASALRRPLADFAQQHAWVPYMRTAGIEEQTTGAAKCVGVTNLPWPIADRTWTIMMRNRTEGDRFIASWDYVPDSGNLRDTSGSWSVEDLGDGRSRVQLEAMADVGKRVPGALLRWAERRSLPETLQALLDSADR